MIDWALRKIAINIVKARPDKSLLKNRNMTIRVKLSLFVLRQLNCDLPLCLLCQVWDLVKKWPKIGQESRIKRTFSNKSKEECRSLLEKIREG